MPALTMEDYQEWNADDPDLRDFRRYKYSFIRRAQVKLPGIQIVDVHPATQVATLWESRGGNGGQFDICLITPALKNLVHRGRVNLPPGLLVAKFNFTTPLPAEVELRHKDRRTFSAAMH